MTKGTALACQSHSTDGRQQGGAWEARPSLPSSLLTGPSSPSSSLLSASPSPKEDKPCVTSGCCTLHRTHSWKWNLLPASLRQEKDIPVIRDQKHRFDINITSHVSGWSQMWFEKRLAGLDTWTETCLGSGRMGGQQKSRDDWMAVLIFFYCFQKCTKPWNPDKERMVRFPHRVKTTSEAFPKISPVFIWLVCVFIES